MVLCGRQPARGVGRVIRWLAYLYSEDRKAQHPAAHLKGFRGLLQVDGYAGFGRLVREAGDAAPQLAFCWAHTRRKFFDIHTANQSPLAAEALQRIAALYEIEAEIRGWFRRGAAAGTAEPQPAAGRGDARLADRTA